MPMPKWRYLSIAILCLLLVPALAACGSSGGGGTGSSKPGANVKVGLVADTGGLNDKGFNQLANQGLMQAEHDLGVQGAVKVSQTANDYEPNLTYFATRSYNLVIAVGFLMQPVVGKVAKEFPNVHFAVVDGDATDANFNAISLPNVVGLHFKEQEAGALVGVIAGMLEKAAAPPLKGTGVISAVGGQKIPPVDHYIAGYQWAAAMEDPGVKVLVDYSDDFSDSAKCRDFANSQIGRKSEIVFAVAGGCGNGALAAAGQKGVYSIGVDTDQKALDPSVIASAIKRVDVSVDGVITDEVNKQFKAGTKIFDLNNGGVGFTPGNVTLSSAITDEVNKVEGEIKAGTVTVPDTVSNSAT